MHMLPKAIPNTRMVPNQAHQLGNVAKPLVRDSYKQHSKTNCTT